MNRNSVLIPLPGNELIRDSRGQERVIKRGTYFNKGKDYNKINKKKGDPDVLPALPTAPPEEPEASLSQTPITSELSR